MRPDIYWGLPEFVEKVPTVKEALTRPFWIVVGRDEWEARAAEAKARAAEARDKGDVTIDFFEVGDWVIFSFGGVDSSSRMMPSQYLGTGYLGIDGGHGIVGIESCDLQPDGSCVKANCTHNCCPGVGPNGQAICTCTILPCPSIVIGGANITQDNHAHKHYDLAIFEFMEAAGGKKYTKYWIETYAADNVQPIQIGSVNLPINAGCSIGCQLRLVEHNVKGTLTVTINAVTDTGSVVSNNLPIEVFSLP